MTGYYGKTDNKSTVRTSETKHETRAYISGEGSARSNEREILRELSSGLVSSIDHANQIAYDIHMRTKK